ncbi:MAG: hypothetical protein WCP01_05260 [Methylococcaceae bacterium]
MKKTLLATTLVMSSVVAQADYTATGDITGYSYTTIGSVFQAFHTATPRKLYAERDKEGVPRYIRKSYPDRLVEYKPKNGLCNVQVKVENDSANTIVNIITAAANTINDRTFLAIDKNGEYEDIEVQSLQFKCRHTGEY